MKNKVISDGGSAENSLKNLLAYDKYKPNKFLMHMRNDYGKIKLSH